MPPGTAIPIAAGLRARNRRSRPPPQPRRRYRQQPRRAARPSFGPHLPSRLSLERVIQAMTRRSAALLTHGFPSLVLVWPRGGTCPPYRAETSEARPGRRRPTRTAAPPLNGSVAVVLVVAAPPEAGFVAAEWRAVEPLVHAPQAVQPARVRRVGVVDDAILERERAHAGSFSPVGRPVRADDARCELVEPGTVLTGRRPEVRRLEVVLDCSRLPLLLGDRRLEVVVEVAAGRRRPGEAPAHPPLVGLQFRERSPRHPAERNVVVGEVDDGAVEAVRDRRAGRAPCGVLGPEHEVVGEQLRASCEQIGEGRRALVGLEAVLLVDAHPGQLLPPPRQFVAASRQRLLGLEQLQPGRQPLFTGSGLVIGHCFSPSCCSFLLL